MARAALWLGTLLLASAPAWAQQPAWHHPPSPFRVALKIVSQPAPAKAGYFLEVPVCSLGDPDGGGVFVFDASGAPLPVLAAGRTRNNAALVICGGDLKNDATVFAYWGGHQNAPQARQAFTPGLLVELRTVEPGGSIKDWPAAQRLLQKSVRLGVLPVSQIDLATNPLDDTDAFIMDFNGYLVAPQNETWELFLASDDAGYLFVNDPKLPVIERDGKHWAGDERGAGRQACNLLAGLNPVRCVVIDVGGNQMAVLARWFGPRQKAALPPAAFAVSGLTRLGSVEVRNKNQICPAFATQLVSYLGIENLQFTVFELRTYTNQEVEWTLSNGMRGKSAVFRQVALGTNTLTVEAIGKDKTAAHGLIQFGAIPPAVSWRDPDAYRQYAELMLAQGLANLTPACLQAYLEFFRLYDRNPDTATVCEYLLTADKNLRPDRRLTLTLDLARGTARRAPEKARRAYRQLLAGEPKAAHQDLAVEAFEFELYRQGDFAAAADAAAVVRKLWGAETGEYERCLAELALLRDPPEKAATAIESYRAHQVAKAPRQATVRANSLVENFREQLRAGFGCEAENLLRQWLRLAPDALVTGQYALLRGRYLRDLGWTTGAYALVNQTLALNPLAAYLPELEFEKALILREQNQLDEAQTLFQKIATLYPNHPVADQARRHLK